MQNDPDKVERPATDSRSWKSRPLFAENAWDSSRGMEGVTRRPPRVVRVPPPKGSFVSPGVFFWGAIVFINALSFTATGNLHWAFLILVTLAFFVALLADIRRSFRRNRKIEWFRRRHADWLADPAAALLDRHWYFASIPPSVEKIERLLRREKADPLDGAVIVCLAALAVPEPGDHRQEPEVIKLAGHPAGFAALPAAIGLLMIIAAILLPVFDVVKQIPDYFIPAIIVAATLATVAWQYLVQPRYLRVVPGVVQFLRYASPGSRPTIKNYPLAAGTLIVIRQKRGEFELTAVRDSARDAATLGRSACDEARWGNILRALVSTAPPPPLSAEELVG